MGFISAMTWAASQYRVAHLRRPAISGMGCLVPLALGGGRETRAGSVSTMAPLSLDGGGLLFIPGRAVRSWVALFDLASMRLIDKGFSSPPARTLTNTGLLHISGHAKGGRGS